MNIALCPTVGKLRHNVEAWDFLRNNLDYFFRELAQVQLKQREKIIMVTNSVFFGLNNFIIFVKNSGFQDILDIYSLHINLVSIFSVLIRTLS